MVAAAVGARVPPDRVERAVLADGRADAVGRVDVLACRPGLGSGAADRPAGAAVGRGGCGQHVVEHVCGREEGPQRSVGRHHEIGAEVDAAGHVVVDRHRPGDRLRVSGDGAVQHAAAAPHVASPAHVQDAVGRAGEARSHRVGVIGPDSGDLGPLAGRAGLGGARGGEQDDGGDCSGAKSLGDGHVEGLLRLGVPSTVRPQRAPVSINRVSAWSHRPSNRPGERELRERQRAARSRPLAKRVLVEPVSSWPSAWPSTWPWPCPAAWAPRRTP